MIIFSTQVATKLGGNPIILRFLRQTHLGDCWHLQNPAISPFDISIVLPFLCLYPHEVWIRSSRLLRAPLGFRSLRKRTSSVRRARILGDLHGCFGGFHVDFVRTCSRSNEIVPGDINWM